MAEHGILMRDEMVRALLREPGDPLRKTVTRRTSNEWAKRKAGDLLWVRECWNVGEWTGDGGPRCWFESPDRIPTACPAGAKVIYRADGVSASAERPLYRSGIHMPRWASRLTLRIVDLRREAGLLPDGLITIPLPHVDDAEARREGVEDRAAYLALWESINGPVYPEWLWRIEFEEVQHG